MICYSIGWSGGGGVVHHSYWYYWRILYLVRFTTKWSA